MPEITRRSLLAGVLGALATPALWAVEQTEPATAAVASATASVPFRKTFRIGSSVQGRAIKVRRLGYASRPVRVVIVGCIHGNEDDGRAVVGKLWKWTPPSDTCVYLISTMNPDGNAASDGNALHLTGRLNAHGVNLNRNFPGGIRTGRPGMQSYSGPRNLSEPESRAVHRFLKKVDPDVLVVYHQHKKLVDYCGGDKALQHRYASRTKLRFTRLTRYRGSMATWLHDNRPNALVMSVELPARNSAASVRRHQLALKRLIREYSAENAS